MAAQILRRRAQHDVRHRDLPRNQRRRLQPRRRRPDRHVETFVDQFDDAVRQGDLDGHLRKLRGVVGERAHHVAQAERRQRRHPQLALRHHARRADRLSGFVELRQHLREPLVVFAAGFGGRDAARRPVEQARAELLLEMHHVLARHRRGHLHLFRRADKAPHFDDVTKHFHADEGIHGNRSR